MFIQWINWDERATGLNHPSRPDVVNRPLRQALQALGISPDVDISAPWLTQAQGDLLYEPISGGPLVVDWGDITGKPSTFTPSAHAHVAGDITSGTVATARLGSGTADNTT